MARSAGVSLGTPCSNCGHPLNVHVVDPGRNEAVGDSCITCSCSTYCADTPAGARGPAELIIARLPGRTGLYLGFQEGTAWRSVARFSRGEESAEEFMAWARQSGIRCEDDRKKEG